LSGRPTGHFFDQLGLLVTYARHW